jgi:nucleotide-binding universal stress UspA family protein
MPSWWKPDFDRVQAEAIEIAGEHGVKLGTVVAPGSPAETIVKTARAGKYDLIVMGHKGHSRVHEYLVGATHGSGHTPRPMLGAYRAG